MSTDPIAVAHARELLAWLESTDVNDMDMPYAIGAAEHTVRALLEVVDERRPSIPDTAHSFVSADGARYTCERCGRVADHESVYYLSVLEECGGEPS